MHIKLWHKEFWYMAVAGLLLSAAMFTLVPVMPEWLTGHCGLSTGQTAIVMGISGIGSFLLGGFTSFLVQRYRRNIICLRAIFVFMLTFVALYYIERGSGFSGLFTLLCLFRIVQGAVYGEARIVLGSTLIIDTCESFQRTAANHSAGWFMRFGLALGPAVALIAMPFGGLGMVLAVAACMCAAAYLLIAMVKFPFKAPDDSLCKFSLDRFLLKDGWGLALNILPISTAVGLVLVSNQGLCFYSMMMCGFFLALLAQRFLFVRAEPKSEVVSGLLLVCAAIMIMMTGRAGAAQDMAGVIFGCGIGIVFARFLLSLISMSDHCQRGTAQSTFFLTCELGVSVGISFGIGFFHDNTYALFSTALCVAAMSLALYLSFTHGWFMAHRHR